MYVCQRIKKQGSVFQQITFDCLTHRHADACKRHATGNSLSSAAYYSFSSCTPLARSRSVYLKCEHKEKKDLLSRLRKAEKFRLRVLSLAAVEWKSEQREVENCE